MRRIITVLTTFMICNFLNFAEAQNPNWTLPGGYLETGLNVYLPLPQSPINPVTSQPETDPALAYQGQPATYTHGAYSGPDGDILCFVVDGMLYDRNGWAVNQLRDTPQPAVEKKGSNELLILPMGNSCSRFCIIYPASASGNSFGTSSFMDFFWGVYDLEGSNNYNTYAIGNLEGAGASGSDATLHSVAYEYWQNHYDPTKTLFNINQFGNYSTYYKGLQIAATPLIDNCFRYIWFFDGGNLIRYKLDGSGMHFDNYSYEFGGGSNTNLRSEMELIRLSNGNYRIAIPMAREAENPSRSIQIADIDDATMEVIASTHVEIDLGDDASNTPAEPYGLEYDSSGRYLYFTHKQNSNWPNVIDIWDVQTSSALTFTVPASMNAFQNSFIERSGDNLYLAKSDGLGLIPNASTPGSGFNPGLVQFPTSQGPYGNEGGMGPGALRFVLPDQVDDDGSYGDFQNFSCACCEAYSSGSITSFESTQNSTWTPGNNPLNGGTGPVAVINDELRIAPGTQITIDGMELRFKPDARVVVKRGDGILPGGVLIIEDSKLTADSDCSSRSFGVCNGVDQGCDFDFWEGIIVEGHDNQGQNSSGTSQQGMVVIRKQSTVEFARIAVRSGHPTDSGYGGGIVGISNSTIKDNIQGVLFDPYIRLDAQQVELWTTSSIRNTEFITTSEFITSGGSFPARFIGLYGSSGVRIRGCLFENQAPGLFNFFQTGIGIFISDSRASVSWYCDGGQMADCSDGSIVRSTFRNIWMGVYGINTAQNTRKLTVGYSVFDQVVYGLTLNNYINPDILDNDFLIPRVPDIYGAALVSSTGYSIENNTFRFAPGTGTPNSNGLLIIDSGTANNLVYRNRFTDLETATTAQGVNGVTYGPIEDPEPPAVSGLRYRCNIFDAPIRTSDIFVASGVIHPNQGFCNPALTNSPPGNLFSHSSTTTPGHADFRLNVPGVDPFLEVTYRHHLTPPQRLEPLVATPPPGPGPGITLVECVTIPFDDRESCPVNKSIAPIVIDFDLGKSGDEYAEMDGDETPWSADEIFAEAAEWEALVEEAEAASLQAEVAADNDLLAMTLFERDEFWKRVVDYHQTDTLGHLSDTQLITLLDTYTPEYASRYASSMAAKMGSNAPTWVDADDDVLASVEMLTLASAGEDLPMEQVERFENGFFANHANTASLNAAYAEAGAWYLPHALYFEDADAQDGAKSDNQNPEVDNNNWARIYPNPFNAQLTIELNHEEIDGGAVVAFYDLAGRRVSSVQIQNGQSALVLEGNKLPAGILIYEIISDRGEAQRGKLIRLK